MILETKVGQGASVAENCGLAWEWLGLAVCKWTSRCLPSQKTAQTAALMSADMIFGGKRAHWTLNFAFVGADVFASGYLPYLGDPLKNKDLLSCFSSFSMFALCLILLDVPEQPRFSSQMGIMKKP